MSEAAVVDLLGTIQILQRHVTESLCATVWAKERTTERQREWSLHQLVQFWVAVILRAPVSLGQALEEARRGAPGLLPPIRSSDEGFFQRCQTLSWRFFAAVFEGFVERVRPEAPAVYAGAVHGLSERFSALLVLDGSRLDAMAHTLKLLRSVRAVVLPGCLLVAYDLLRGVVRVLHLSLDAAQSELERARTVLGQVPKDALVLADRLFALPCLFTDLAARGLWGLCRRNRLVKLRKVAPLSRTPLPDGELEDWVVDVGGRGKTPACRLRWIRQRQGRHVLELVTNVLDPTRLSAAEACELYRHRWSVERVFFDLKEVLNLHCFYPATPNAIAMQVYAAAIVYVAFRVAQGQLAQVHGVAPETLSPAKLYPKLTAAASTVVVWDHRQVQTETLNPGMTIRWPTLDGDPAVTTTLAAITVDPRQGKRRRRRFCASRRQWKSLRHIPGGRKLT